MGNEDIPAPALIDQSHAKGGVLVISFSADVSGRDYYSRAAERLRSCLNRLGIAYEIEEKPSLGSYRANCLSKPAFILEHLNDLRRPLLWLDVDSVVYKPLTIFDQIVAAGIDVAAATTDGYLTGMRASPLLFGDTDLARAFLSDWAEACARQLEESEAAFDHEQLFAVFHRFEGRARIAWVGPEYCAWPHHQEIDTVIEMGLSDDDGKVAVLRAMGVDEDEIRRQTPGLV